MCDEKMAVVGRAAGRRAQRQHDAQVAADAVRSYVNGAAPKKEHGPLAITLCVVAAIVLLASMNAILHALLIAVISILGVAALGGGVLLARRVRALSQPQVAPWLPQAPPRTEVKSVSVRALGPGEPRTGALPRARQAWPSRR